MKSLSGIKCRCAFIDRQTNPFPCFLLYYLPILFPFYRARKNSISAAVGSVKCVLPECKIESDRVEEHFSCFQGRRRAGRQFRVFIGLHAFRLNYSSFSDGRASRNTNEPVRCSCIFSFMDAVILSHIFVFIIAALEWKFRSFSSGNGFLH